MKGINLYLFLVAAVGALSCSQRQNENGEESEKVYQTKYFRMKIPKNWTFVNQEGIDASVFMCVSGKDTIKYEVSPYANNLSEKEPDIKPKSAEGMIDSAAKAENKIIFASDRDLSQGIDLDNYRRQNVTFKALPNGRELKVTTPRRPGIGITGAYCDSLGYDPPIGRIKFNIYGENLSEETAKDLLQSISTIEFQKTP